MLPLYKTVDYVLRKLDNVEQEILRQKEKGWRMESREVSSGRNPGDSNLCTLTFKWVGDSKEKSKGFSTKNGMYIFPCIICKEPNEMPTKISAVLEAGQYMICPKCTEALKAVIKNEQLKQN